MSKGKILTLLLSGALATNISPINFVSVINTEESSVLETEQKDDEKNTDRNEIEILTENSSDTSVNNTSSNLDEVMTDSTIDTATKEQDTYSLETKGIQGSPKISEVFPDPNVAQEIASSLSKQSSSSITQTDLNKITILVVENREVSNIEGIQHLTNLEKLSFQGARNIVSLLPLQNADMPKLRFLYLKGNQISNLDPLSNLVALEELYVDNNNIESLTPLSTLSNLKKISFQNDDSDGNQVTSLSGLENALNLTTIYGKNNKVSSTKPLKNLSNLREVYLEGNSLTNLEGLEDKSNLTDLSIMYQDITDISNIKESVNLRNLYIRENQISDIKVIANFTSLKLLLMESNQVSDISPLKNLNLETFNGEGQKIILESIPFLPDKEFTISNMILGKLGETIAPSEISNLGIYQDTGITWKLPSGITTVTFNWETKNSLLGKFSGTVIQPLEEKEGELYFNEAPTQINFGSHNVSNTTLNVYGQVIGGLKITDERASSRWRLQLKESQPLTSNGFEMSGILSFVTSEESKDIGKSAITILDSNQKGESDLTKFFDSASGKGIKASIPVEYQRIGTFKGTLEWTLEDVP